MFLMEQMEQVKFLYPLYLREENKELKLNGHTILREWKMIIYILFWNDVPSALCIWGFRICRFKHLGIEDIGGNCYVVDVLGLYWTYTDFFSCPYSLNNTIQQLFT